MDSKNLRTVEGSRKWLSSKLRMGCERKTEYHLFESMVMMATSFIETNEII